MSKFTEEERIMFTKYYIFNERIKELGLEKNINKRKEKYENLKKEYLEEYNKVYQNEQMEDRDIILKAYEEILLSLGFTNTNFNKVKKM